MLLVTAASRAPAIISGPSLKRAPANARQHVRIVAVTRGSRGAEVIEHGICKLGSEGQLVHRLHHLTIIRRHFAIYFLPHRGSLR